MPAHKPSATNVNFNANSPHCAKRIVRKCITVHLHALNQIAWNGNSFQCRFGCNS